MPTVALIRHGQASFGSDDYDVLSDTGRRQATLLAESLRGRGMRPSRLICGTLHRQRETAEAFGSGPELTVDARWDEYDSNAVLAHHAATEIRLDGPGVRAPSSAEFRVVLEPALEAWVASAEDSPTPQTWTAFAALALEALDDLGREMSKGETAVVVSSGGVIAALAGSLLGVGGATFATLTHVMVNTGVSKIGLSAAGDATLITLNDHSHLEAAGRELITYQ